LKWKDGRFEALPRKLHILTVCKYAQMHIRTHVDYTES
jgi:hypothetical protein